jgi:glycosyltransferase involved in cell wall biosynthesis
MTPGGTADVASMYPIDDCPLVSLIIPHHNHNELLPRLLDSILAQTLHDLEVIVVDDHSERSCADIISDYAVKGLSIQLIRNEIRQYTKNCRIIGVEASRGQVICFADADDVLLGTEVLEYHARLLLREDADIVGFAARNSISNSKVNLQSRATRQWTQPFVHLVPL